jgi:hypothetical protein
MAAEADHVHLVCSTCGRITQVPPDAVDALVTALDENNGFQTDLGHLTVYGRCATCRAGDRDVTSRGAGRHDHRPDRVASPRPRSQPETA